MGEPQIGREAPDPAAFVTAEQTAQAEQLNALTPQVSVAAEPLAHFGPFDLTNSMLTMWITMAVMLVLAWAATRRIRRDPDAAMIPQGLQNVVEAVVESLAAMVESAVGRRYARRVFAFGATFFVFITISNWFSLLPGIGTIWIPVEHQGHEIAAPLFRPATADLNMTLALALTAFVVIHASGISSHGLLGHLKEMTQIAFLAPVFIIIELFVIVSLSFRLFGNLFAGEVLLNGPILAGFALGHIPLIGAVFLLLEILFGLIQAVIFFMLSMVFTGQAVGPESAEAH